MADRGVSEVLSYVLVFSLVIASITLVSVGGLDSLRDARDNEQMDNAERAFDLLADNIADVYQRGAPSRATEVNLKEAQLRTGDNVTMVVNVTTTGGGNQTVGQWQVRPIIYEGNRERHVVYTAGAVFRTNPDSGIRLRDPPLVATGQHVLVTVPGLNSESIESHAESTVLVRVKSQDIDTAFQSRRGDVENVGIKVTGPRADLWRAYFASKGFDCGTAWCTYDGGGTIQRVYVVYHDISVTIDR